MKVQRHDYRKHTNFDETVSEPTVSSAVAAANLVSMVDPAAVGEDEVAVLAKATNTPPDFIQNMVELVDEANNSTESVDRIQETFSRVARKLIARCRVTPKRRDFAADDPAKSVVETTQIIGMLDDEALDTLPTEEIAETVAAATETPPEVVAAIVDVAKDNFSAGRKYQIRKHNEFNRKVRHYFDNEVVEEPSKPDVVTCAVDPTKEPELVDPAKLVPPTTEVAPEQVAQTTTADTDPKPGDVVSDPTEAADAMMVQNELATVQKLEDVPVTKMGTFNRKSGVNSTVFTLKELLGDKYVPND